MPFILPKAPASSCLPRISTDTTARTLDEQKKKAQASGDTALAKAIGEQQDQLHAENEALGKTIGATYDKSGHWSLNGSTLYDPAADRSSGEFSGGGSALSGGIRAAADGDIASLESAFGNMNGTEKHYLPGIGWKNVGQAVADLFQTAVNGKGGVTGEISTEISEIYAL